MVWKRRRGEAARGKNRGNYRDSIDLGVLVYNEEKGVSKLLKV